MSDDSGPNERFWIGRSLNVAITAVELELLGGARGPAMPARDVDGLLLELRAIAGILIGSPSIGPIYGEGPAK